MLFSELYTILANKVNLKVFGGDRPPLYSPLSWPPADANDFDGLRIQNSLLEFSVKHTHNCHSFRIYMFSNNGDLKTNNRNYVKPFWILRVREIASINLFQVDFDKSWNYVWYCYMKGTCAPVALSKSRGGSAPVMHPRSGVPVHYSW